MLRHIRMTSKVEPVRLPSKLATMLADHFRALYPITIPHRTPTIGEPDPVCMCKYPIFTLCTPEPSPYDLGPAPCVTASPAGAATADAAVAAAAEEPIRASREGDTLSSSLRVGTASSHTNGTMRRRERGSESIVCKTRPVLRVRGLWRGRVSQEIYHSNIIPNRPTCYRCDICDGFQEVRDGEADPSGAGHSVQPLHESSPLGAGEAAVRDGGPVPPAPTTADTNEGAACTEDAHCRDEEDEESEEFHRRPVSTDIANTIMEDREVAELRYSDPFLVEVIGRPHTGSLSRMLNKQFSAQLARCGVTVKDLARRAPQAFRNAKRYSAVYDYWSAQQQLEKTQAARERRGGAVADRVAFLRQKTELLDTAAYTVRFALAAYGLPYELGYFNSVVDVMKMHAEPHRRYTCATSEEQMGSMRRMVQGEKPNELMEFAASRYSISVGKPCYAIVLDHEARRVVLTFRGSLTTADVVVDITEGYAEIELLAGGARGVVAVEAGAARSPVPLERLSPARQRRYGDHSAALTGTGTGDGGEDAGVSPPAPPTPAEVGAELGMRTRVPLGFYEAVREAALTLLPALDAVHAQYPDYELLVTGHSLGGIEAALFHLLYCFPPHTAAVRFHRVQTMTFGAAPLVEEHVLGPLNAALVAEEQRSGSRLVQFSYGKDIVSRLHVRGLLQALTEKAEESTSAGAPAVVGVASRRVSRVADAVNGAMPDLSVLPQLALPGTCYNIPHRLRRGYFAVADDCPWRSQIILSVEAVSHHFPLLYARAINRLLQYYTERLTEAQQSVQDTRG